MTRSKLPALIGSAVAIASFFFVGLRPAMAFGRHAGHLLAGGVGAESSGVVARSLGGFGPILASIGVASLFAVLGAMVGALIGAVTRLDVRKAAAPAAHKAN